MNSLTLTLRLSASRGDDDKIAGNYMVAIAGFTSAYDKLSNFVDDAETLRRSETLRHPHHFPTSL